MAASNVVGGTSVWRGMGHGPVWCGVAWCSGLCSQLQPPPLARSFCQTVSQCWRHRTACTERRIVVWLYSMGQQQGRPVGVREGGWEGGREGVGTGQGGGQLQESQFCHPISFMTRLVRTPLGIWCVLQVPFYCVACMRLPSRRLLVCLRMCIDRGVA